MRPAEAETEGTGGGLAAIVAARDEADRIAATVAALRAAFPAAAIWVADDASRDGTAELALAAGYLALAWHIVFVLMRHGARVAGRDVGQVALPLFLAVLVPSALWLPLTFDMIAAPSAALWWTIRGVLALVAIGSLGLWAVAAFARPVGSTKTRLGAVIGGAFFCLQTVVLDAIVWTALYPFG